MSVPATGSLSKAAGGRTTLDRREDLLQRAEPRICAFDIETTKLPLQFPNSEYDQVFMISYMLDRQGYLIVNREVVSQDVADFEFTPKPEFEGPFKVFNCADEAASLRCWFDHMRQVQPAVYVTYNGDYFDWPFIQTRAAKCGMDMEKEIGFECDGKGGACLSKSGVHMDCLHWVNRDSYLPQGSRGLKVSMLWSFLLEAMCFFRSHRGPNNTRQKKRAMHDPLPSNPTGRLLPKSSWGTTLLK
jgi:DNA polymerase epsilon subunit 1